MMSRSQRPSPRRIARSVASVLTLLLAMGCTVIGECNPLTVADRVVAASAFDPLPLRGDPAFVPDELGVAQRAMYDSFKAQLVDPRDDHVDWRVMASSDDVWWYGHYLHTHVHTTLLMFRMTGDLDLLDHVDEVLEVMRSDLHDSWRDTKDGTNGTRDGYLNWVQRYVAADSWYGKDLNFSYEMKTHAMVVMAAYALHGNRDLTSPGGRDYGANADFWKDYLVNHFEAKWRSREGVTDGSFPISSWPDTNNTYVDWLKWHYYMGLLTGDQAYTTEAARMSGILMREFLPRDTPAGTTYVWPRGRTDHSTGQQYDYLMPIGYAEFIYAAAIDLHLEGFGAWAGPVHLERMARGITEYVMDDPDPISNGLARTVGGEENRCGVAYRATYGSQQFPRINAWRYERHLMGQLAAWDPTGAIHALNVAMSRNADDHNRDSTRMLAAIMLYEYLHADPSDANSEPPGSTSANATTP
jgi:hypothetical protein